MDSLLIKFDGDAEPQLLHVSGELPLLCHPVGTHLDVRTVGEIGLRIKADGHPELILPAGMELVVRRSGDSVEVVTRGRT